MEQTRGDSSRSAEAPPELHPDLRHTYSKNSYKRDAVMITMLWENSYGACPDYPRSILKEVDYREARAVARLIEEVKTAALVRSITVELSINTSCIHSPEAFQRFLKRFRLGPSDDKTPATPSPPRERTEEIERPFPIPVNSQIPAEGSPKRNRRHRYDDQYRERPRPRPARSTSRDGRNRHRRAPSIDPSDSDGSDFDSDRSYRRRRHYRDRRQRHQQEHRRGGTLRDLARDLSLP